MPDIEKIAEFLAAHQEAQDKGEHYFTCPICGGQAHWTRDNRSKHLHCACSGCGIRMME